MAHALSITDGTTTISLSGTNWLLVDFVPNTPSYRNGRYDPVTENIELLTDTSSGANAQSAIEAVEKLLQSAQRRQRTQTGAKVYLQLQLDSDGSAWRSEVLQGAIQLGVNSMRAWNQGKVECTLIVERVHFWEGALTALFSGQSLTNADGTNSYYSSATVSGVLATPAKITLDNNSGGTQYQRTIYLGVNAFNSPSTWDGTLGSKTLSDTAPYTFSTIQATHSLSDADLTAMRGDPMRIVGNFSAAGNAPGVWWKWEQRFGANWLAESEPIYPPDIGVMDFGIMPIPVGGYDTSTTEIDIVLRCQSESITLYGTMAFTQIFPATPGAFQKINLTGNVDNTEDVVIDGIEGRAYVTETGGDNIPIVYPEGGPLLLHPGQGHRFIWLLRESDGRAGTETCSMSVSYRPRRLTV